MLRQNRLVVALGSSTSAELPKHNLAKHNKAGRVARRRIFTR